MKGTRLNKAFTIVPQNNGKNMSQYTSRTSSFRNCSKKMQNMFLEQVPNQMEAFDFKSNV